MGNASPLSYTGRKVASTEAPGRVQPDSSDFSLADGVLSLNATGNVADIAADSGAITPAAGLVTIAGGTGVTTTGSGAQCSVAVDEDFIRYAEVTLTAAQVKGLAAAPFELVAAPGAGKAVKFLGALLKLNYGSEVFTESADNMQIKYENASGAGASSAIEATGFIDQSADTYTNAEPAADVIVAATGIENKALVLDNTGDGEYAGNASNDSTLTVGVSYAVYTL